MNIVALVGDKNAPQKGKWSTYNAKSTTTGDVLTSKTKTIPSKARLFSQEDKKIDNQNKEAAEH